MERVVRSFEDKELSNGDKSMSTDVLRAQSLMHEAWPDLTVEGKGRVKSALWEAYNWLKPRVQPQLKREFMLRRVRSLHEGAAYRVDGVELAALEDATRRMDIEEMRNEQKRLRARLASLDQKIAIFDQKMAAQSLEREV